MAIRVAKGSLQAARAAAGSAIDAVLAGVVSVENPKSPSELLSLMLKCQLRLVHGFQDEGR
jgi:hypothetical protein